MRLSMEEVQKQHESTKKLYEQGLTVAPVDVKQVIDLYDTIEALQQENEQLQAQVTRVREALRKAREALITTIKGIDNKKIIPANADAAIELWRHKQQISNALAEIDKVIGGKEDV